MFQKYIGIVLSASVLMISANALAFPMPKTYLRAQDLPATFTQDYNFDGIVALDNCSGSIVQFEGAQSTEQAMVLTNGHCFEGGMPEAGQAIYQQPSSRRFTVLDAKAQEIGSLSAVQVIYSTMTKTDITLYQLQESYQDIEQKFGVHAFVIASQHPAVGTNMEVVSGYWQRGYSCQIEAFVNELHEDQWTMIDSIRYSRPGCDTIGGTSGSPIVQAGTHNIIGINNTGNENGDQCTMNNPCEIDKAGKVTAEKGVSYGQQTYSIYSCVNTERHFDLTTPGCALTMPK